MTSQEDTCQRVQSFLKTKFQVSSVPFPWIEGCVTWFRNINPNTSNFQVLFDFVAQQWLLADFQQLKIKSLPANLKNSPVVKLDENYLLQVAYIINVGLSAYSQHLRISKGQENNSEVTAEEKIYSKWEPRSKRMLLLHLTDGTQEIQAMEYVFIPQLNLDIIPGSKILIKGPVECRRGVFLLRPNNVMLLGGEVEELVKLNAPENVLARILGKPENPNPVYGSYTIKTFNPDEADESSMIGVSTLDGSKGKAEVGGSQCSLNVTRATQPTQPTQKWKSSSCSTFPVGREKRTLNDNQLPPAKKLHQHPPPPPPSSMNRQPSDAEIFPDDDDDILLLAADIPVDVVEPEPAQHPADTPSLAHSTVSRSMAPASSSFHFNAVNAAIVANLSANWTPPASFSSSCNDPARPFTYLSAHLRQRSPGDPAATICVKGFISTIRTKLEAREGKWRLGAKINDGSSGMDVDFAHEVLEGLIGYSPMGLKSLMAKDGENKRLAVEVSR